MEKYIVNTIDIKTSAAEVWDTLTNPEKTKIYMFGCETVSDWKIGSPLLWRGSYEGNEMVFVTGFIVAIEPYQTLTYSVFDPNSAMEDKLENYLNVTYDLKESNGTTTLTVTQGDYTAVAEGEKRYLEAYNSGEGWNSILVEIKKLVESQTNN